jgi:hypothetical protein
MEDSVMNGIDFDQEGESLFVDVMDKYVIWRLKDLSERDEDYDEELADVRAAAKTLLEFME